MSAATTIHQPGMGTPVFMKIGLAIVACLAVLMGVALAVVFSQISDARVEMGLMRTALSAVNDRLGIIEKSVDDARAALNKITLNEQRPVSVTPDVVAGFYVTHEEAKIIREFLNVPPKNATPAAKMALWIRVPPQATKPLPEPLVSRLEKLRGLLMWLTPIMQSPWSRPRQVSSLPSSDRVFCPGCNGAAGRRVSRFFVSNSAKMRAL